MPVLPRGDAGVNDIWAELANSGAVATTQPVGSPQNPPPPPGGTNTGDPVAFIRQWQATHPATVNAPQEIVQALQQAGFNASPYLYGNTPSGNEITLNGEKFKVIGGENSGSPSWYRGENDSPGQSSGGFSLQGLSGVAPYQAPGLLTPYANELTMPSQADLEADPGYQFRLDQGLKALGRSQAAKGTYLSGGHEKDAMAFASGLASDEYNDLFGRNLQLAGFNRGSLWGNEQNAYGMLSGLSGQGLSAIGQQNAAGSQYGNNAVDLYTNQGTANAAAGQQRANAYNNLFGNLMEPGYDLYQYYAGGPNRAGGGGYNPYGGSPYNAPNL